MKFPHTVSQEVAIHIYFGTMDSLTSIFLRRLPPRDIDTIEKVFKEAVTFTNVTTAPMPTLTYSGYESQKTTFFEQKAVGSTEAENNMARELKAMKETMSLLSDELVRIKSNSSRDQGNHPTQLATQNNYSQNQRGNFNLYRNINNENNRITGMSSSENGYGYNDVLDQPHQIMEQQPLQFSAMMFESHDKSAGGKNDEDGQEEFVFPFNEEILPSLNVSTNVDMPRNFEDMGNFEVPELHEVSKGDGNTNNLEVAENFESGDHEEEDTNSSYCDIDSPLDKDKIPPSKQDLSLEEMDRMFNVVSILTEEMSICGYSTYISNHAIAESCRIHPFEFHSEESCPDFLLAWEIAMEGKGDFEQASLGYEAENILIDDIDEEMVIDFFGSKEPKVFPRACEAVNREISFPEREVTMCECTPMVRDLLDQVIYFHYPS